MFKRIDLIKPGGIRAGENLAVTEVPKLTAGPGQVLLDIKASAINPVDWKMAVYNFLIPEAMPVALGCDVAGIDTSSGKRVLAHVGCNKTLHATDRAAYAQQVVVDADFCTELPADMSFAEGASLPVGAMTGIWLLDELKGAVEPDSWVLVWGASSSVGFNTIQLAVQRGLKPIAVASGKHEASLQAIGTAAFVDYNKDDVEAKVKEILGASGKLSGAVDCIGIESTSTVCCKLVKDLGGTVVSCVSGGLPPPPEGVSFKSVILADALDTHRARVIADLPLLVKLKPQKLRLVKGGFTAETLEKAFQLNKDGVSGEKVVIEWTE